MYSFLSSFIVQVCVEECPKEYLTISANTDEMKPFCFSSNDLPLLPFRNSVVEWGDLSPNELVQKEICPAWVIPSDPFLGRCLPSTSSLTTRSNTGSSKCFYVH